MRKLIIIIFIFTLNFSFSQTEKDDYEIYSTVLKDRVENSFKNHFKTIILISKYENKFGRDLEILSEYTSDSLVDYQENLIYTWTNPKTFALEYLKNKKLRKIVSKLDSHFKNHPKIKPELLEVNETKLVTIPSEKYYSYFGKKYKNVKGAWKKIKRKYNTNMVIELSKIEYLDNYATFYYGQHCGGLCGTGILIFMKKTKGKWKKIGEINLWNS